MVLMPAKDVKKRMEANARWKAKYPERAAEQQRRNSAAWKARNPLVYLLSGVKQRAKRDGIEFSITKDDFSELPTHCPVLGLELIYGGHHGDGRTSGGRPCSASVDRINGKLGYVPGNVRIMSWRANSLLKDATPEELEAVVAFLRR